MNKKGKDRYELTEMFIAKADKDRCFFGIIKRWNDLDGKPLVFSKIVMKNNGFIYAQAVDQKRLSKNLNEICIMILDMGLHDDAGVSTEILGKDLFLN